MNMDCNKLMLAGLIALAITGAALLLFNPLQRFCLWLVCDSSIPLGRLGPWIMGLGLGRWPHKVNGAAKKEKP